MECITMYAPEEKPRPYVKPIKRVKETCKRVTTRKYRATKAARITF